MSLTQLEHEAGLAIAQGADGLESKINSAFDDIGSDLKRILWPEGATKISMQASLDYMLLREREGTAQSRLIDQFRKSKAALSFMELFYPDTVAQYRPPYEFVGYMDGPRVGFVVVGVAYDPLREPYAPQASRAEAEAFAATAEAEET